MNEAYILWGQKARLLRIGKNGFNYIDSLLQVEFVKHLTHIARFAIIRTYVL